MTRDVHITITGASLSEDGPEAVTELTARGQYFGRDGFRFLLYEEQDPESGAVTRNTLKIADLKIELTKSGALASRMVFEAGKKHPIRYATPYGLLLLELCTDGLQSVWSDNTGRVELSYRLLTAGALLSRNRLTIEIRNFLEKG